MKIIICSSEAREKNVLAIMDKTWFAGRRERNRRQIEKERGGGNETSVESAAGAVTALDRDLVGCPFALETLAVVYLKKDLGMFVAACVTALRSSKAANAIAYIVEKVEFEGA